MWIIIIACVVDLIIASQRVDMEFFGYFIDAGPVWKSIIYSIELWIIYLAGLIKCISFIINECTYHRWMRDIMKNKDKQE